MTTLKGGDAIRALQQYNQGGRYFYLGEVSDFFKTVCQGYYEKYCTPEKYEERVKNIQEEQTELGRPVTDRDTLYHLLTSSEHRYFERFREIYFMLDRFPENALRFPIEFSDVRD